MRISGTDRKWDELSKILQSDAAEMFLPGGRRRKMIIFTEHKDTLDDLTARLRNHLGRDDAVVVPQVRGERPPVDQPRLAVHACGAPHVGARERITVTDQIR